MSVEQFELKVVGILPEKLFTSFGDVLGCNKMTDNEIVLFCDYSRFDIPIGYAFSTIRDSRHVVLYSGSISLEGATQSFALKYDSIPKGHKTLCKFKFKEGVPESIRTLPTLNDWYGAKTYLILSSS
jgi:hypothetical protein